MSGIGINLNLLTVAAATIVVLSIGTILRLVARRMMVPDLARQRLDSLKSWWAVAIAVILAAILGRVAAALLFAVVSLLALREHRRLTRAAGDDSTLWFATYAAVGVSYLCLACDWPCVFFVWLPLALLILLCGLSLVTGTTYSYVQRLASLYWGAMLVAFLPAHAVLLFSRLAAANPVAGAAGWFLFLMLLTESNDIAQALVGRGLGRRKIAPGISPHKTWAGFVGGLIATMVLAALLAPRLTPLGFVQAAAAGLAIALAGFFGDLNISAVKRSAGAKDSGDLLPGQGGILDRIDSLTFSAPVFYYLLMLFEAPGRWLVQ